MTDTFEFTLNNPLTEEQWDMITDVDFDRTERITFHTKNGKEVEFKKVRHGKWIEHEWAEELEGLLISNYECSECHWWNRNESDYCPHCGAKMKPCDDCQEFDCYGCEYAERKEE